MPKVTNPLFSGDVRGQFGKQLIFTRGGVVRRYFKPRNPNTEAQQAQREAFKEFSVPGLTQEQADLLYSAISHLHDDRYSLLGHDHDADYMPKTPRRILLAFGVYNTINPVSSSGLIPYITTLDRDIVYKKISVRAYVDGTNNGSNYWTIAFHQSGGNVKVFSTAAHSGSSWINFTTDTFDIEEAGVSNIYLRVVCAKVGSPANVYVAGPAVEVECA